MRTFFLALLHLPQRVLDHEDLGLGVGVVEVEVGGDDGDREPREHHPADGAQRADRVPATAGQGSHFLLLHASAIQMKLACFVVAMQQM